jgi:hypothetical protein
MNPIGKVTIKTTGRSTISSPDFKVTPSISIPQLTDVSTIGIENAYTLVYKSATETWEAGPVIATQTEIANITGGGF